MNPVTLAMFGLPGGAEWIIIGLVALLIFGRRLPDVARSIGKSIVEFKKGIKDVKDDVDIQSRLDSPPERKLPQSPITQGGATAGSTPEVISSEPKPPQDQPVGQ